MGEGEARAVECRETEKRGRDDRGIERKEKDREKWGGNGKVKDGEGRQEQTGR